MTLAKKLILVVVVAVTSILLIGGIAFTNSRTNSAAAESTIEDRFQQIVIVGDLQTSFVLLDALVAKAPLELDLSNLEKDRAQFRKIAKQLKSKLSDFQENYRSGAASGQASDANSDNVAKMAAGLEQFVIEGEKVYELSLQFAQRKAFQVLNGGASQARDSVDGAIQAFKDEAKNGARLFVDRVVASRDRLTWTTMAIAVVLFAVVLLMSFFVVGAATRALRAVRAMTGVTGTLATGDMEVQIPGRDRTDEIGEMARSLEQIRAVGVKAARAQASLDDASSAIVIVDKDGTVIFSNKAMHRLHKAFGASLVSQLEGFGADTPTGVQFDLLHNLSSLKSRHLMENQQSVSARMKVAGRTFDLTASPVSNDHGTRLGSVVEWIDKTAQVVVESEIADIVQAASQGDFTQRLREGDSNNFMNELAVGMNQLLNVVDNSLDQVVKVVSALAHGDLTTRMQGEHNGAFGRLKDDVDRMAGQMEEMLGRIAEVSSTVQSATLEISSGISDLSMRTEHQASSLEETTASMEELSATVRQNADNAQDAKEVATAAREAAVTGGEVATNAVSAMSGIEDSSNKITEIVGLIQEIAFQTNLLALNASVEAARAGDAGRGFAVVAREVRELAQRAAGASNDIKELITHSDNQVREGAKLVHEAGNALEEIVDSVKKVAEHVAEIATASQEQTTGIEQVSAAIAGMDEMTQQNSALVEETTSAIHSAQNQVEELQQVVGFFSTAKQATPAQPLAPPVGEPVVNPVLQQQQTLARKVAGGADKADLADPDWQEF